MKLAEYLPVTARSVGVWSGTFCRVNPVGQTYEKLRSEVIFRVFDDSLWPNVYRQTNSFFDEEGNVIQSYDTEGYFDGDRLRYESERVRGWCADDPFDEYGRNSLLFMEILYREDEYVYEIATISDCGNYRARAVQFLHAGKTTQRTLIDEQLVTRDWQAYDEERKAAQP